MSHAALVWVSTLAPAELAGLVTGTSGSSSLSGVVAAGVARAEEAVCRLCTKLTAPKRNAPKNKPFPMFVALPSLDLALW